MRLVVGLNRSAPEGALLLWSGLRADGRLLTIQEQYEEWRSTPDGELVYGAIRQHALRMVDAGWRHYGLKALWEAARYTRALQVGPDELGFKLCNNHTSRMARELMAECPELAGFFDLRELRTP